MLLAWLLFKYTHHVAQSKSPTRKLFDSFLWKAEDFEQLIWDIDNKINYNQSVDLKLNAYYTSGGPFYGPWKM